MSNVVVVAPEMTDVLPEEAKAALPSYACESANAFPDWKVDFIRKNRELYLRHKAIIDPWLPRIRSFAPSFQKRYCRRALPMVR